MCRVNGGRGSARVEYLGLVLAWSSDRIGAQSAGLLVGSCVPLSSVSGFQYRCVSLMGPLWLMRVGRRFGVHFWGLAG